MEQNKNFEFLEHMADIKCKFRGETLDVLFENLIRALSEYMSPDKKVASKKVKTIQVQGTDMSSLMYNFIDEIIYLLDTEGFLVAKGKVTLRGNNLQADLSGDDAKGYTVKQIKAATYAEMDIKKLSQGWEAQVVVDV